MLFCDVPDHILLGSQIISGHTLKSKHQHTYLGLIINDTMQWSPHINSLAIKASKVLNFVKHNSYLSLVRPIMEYASCVWDPNEIVNNQALVKVQRRGARWILSD